MDFDGVDLTGARFRKVRLNEARFRMVDLSGAVLRAVSLAGATIDGSERRCPDRHPAPACALGDHDGDWR